ncbi:hypothetical protein FIN92_06155 [Prevotella brunnea]|uniref:hypothetical protein n=1 Tax=Prevotella brunnea TaxID=2508867 RepID=UPI0028243CEF|nr:hypothetical protein [Prevotella brunnea]MDR0186161.1 hypothetical protein [Prevotella brunnea]
MVFAAKTGCMEVGALAEERQKGRVGEKTKGIKATKREAGGGEGKKWEGATNRERKLVPLFGDKEWEISRRNSPVTVPKRRKNLFARWRKQVQKMGWGSDKRESLKNRKRDGERDVEGTFAKLPRRNRSKKATGGMIRGCLINSRLRANEKLTSRGADDKPRGTRTTNRERCKRGERKVNEALTKKKWAMGKEGRRCKKGWCDK